MEAEAEAVEAALKSTASKTLARTKKAVSHRISLQLDMLKLKKAYNLDFRIPPESR